MKDQLDIVKGGVSKKNLMPILKHLKITNGWVTSTNGQLTISTKLPNTDGLDILVPAEKFILAIKNNKQPTLTVTPGGKLSIKGGKQRILLPLLKDTAFPSPQMTGETFHSEDLITVLKKLKQFIAVDASRPWACGVLIYKNMAYATNNTLLSHCKVQWEGPPIVLPDFLVDELLRLNKRIIMLRTTGKTVTFQLEPDVWIHSTLIAPKWPNIQSLMSKVPFDNLMALPEVLETAILSILPFCPDPHLPKILFTEGQVTTEAGDMESCIEVPNLPESAWRAEPLLNLLEGIKKKGVQANFSLWPAPCPWEREDGVKGLIIGLKHEFK